MDCADSKYFQSWMMDRKKYSKGVLEKDVSLSIAHGIEERWFTSCPEVCGQ